MPFYTEKENAIQLNVRVVPRASKSEISGPHGDALKIRLQAPPVDGKANACLIRFLAKQWDIPKQNIEICSGQTGRSKRLLIRAPSDKMRRELLSIAAG